MFTRSARIAALAVAATALTALAGAPAASAQESQAKSCKPSQFHPTMVRYKNLRKVGTIAKLMPRSAALFNGSTAASALTVGYERNSSWTGTASVNVSTSFGAFGTKVEAELGMSVAHSRGVSRSVSYQLTIPAKHWGWFHPILSGVRISGTKEVVNMICGNVISRRAFVWSGPLKNPPQDMVGKISRTKPV